MAKNLVAVSYKSQTCSYTKRYHLSNGWFIDCALKAYATTGGYKYSLWVPGGDPSGTAGWRGGRNTLSALVADAQQLADRQVAA